MEKNFSEAVNEVVVIGFGKVADEGYSFVGMYEEVADMLNRELTNEETMAIDKAVEEMMDEKYEYYVEENIKNYIVPVHDIAYCKYKDVLKYKDGTLTRKED